MLKHFEFKPTKTTLLTWFHATFNYYIRFCLRRFLYSNSTSLIVKADLEKSKAEESKASDRVYQRLKQRGVTVYQIDHQNVNELFDVVFPWKVRRFKRYFKNGSICFIWKAGGKAVGYSWTSRGKIDEDVKKEYGLNVEIGKDDLWGIDLVVNPEFRGKGIEYLIFHFSLQPLYSQGIKNIYGSVYIGDKGSIRMHERIGFKPLYLHRLQRRLGFKKSKMIPFDETDLNKLFDRSSKK
ncbi:MAG: GNAT family N-acetyltransferase [candidate division Zixibacteria bacterium]|nr:GNAT family N-acetyltransferase [candidate division Zixibacteria bacterium]